jgi:hypothetical protein
VAVGSQMEEKKQLQEERAKMKEQRSYAGIMKEARAGPAPRRRS